MSYSFYVRPENDGDHYVVNYHSSEWWLQLDVVFADKWCWFRFVSYEERPIFNQDRGGILKPKKVYTRVVRGMNDACRDAGTKIAPRHFSFTQADFECYDLYEHAAGHLVRHLLAGGQFAKLEIHQPIQNAIPADSQMPAPSSSTSDEFTEASPLDSLPLDSLPLDQLRVVPSDTEDFDPSCCEQLIQNIRSQGRATLADVSGVGVTLEDFFNGNRTKHSIAANVEPLPPFDTAQSWYEHLRHVREHEAVHDVLVEIQDIEPFDDGRVASWPYSNTLWIYSSLDRDSVAELVAPLDPDEVRDASNTDPEWDLAPPFPAPTGVRPYWIWWD